MGQVCHWIDRPQRLAKRNVNAESVDTMTFLSLRCHYFVGSKRRRTCLCLGCQAIELRCRLLGQGRIVVSADVVIFSGISFSLALSWCGVSTVLNPVPLANLNRLQPIARNEFWCVNGIKQQSKNTLKYYAMFPRWHHYND